MTTNLHAPVIEDHRGRTVANFVTLCPFFSNCIKMSAKKISQNFPKDISCYLIYYSELAYRIVLTRVTN